MLESSDLHPCRALTSQLASCGFYISVCADVSQCESDSEAKMGGQIGREGFFCLNVSLGHGLPATSQSAAGVSALLHSVIPGVSVDSLFVH